MLNLISLRPIYLIMCKNIATTALITAIICGAVIGHNFVNMSNYLAHYTDYTILLLVFFIMFDVNIKHMLTNLNKVKFIVVILITNFIIIPLTGFAISSLFLSAYPLLLMGMVIYFMAPCTDWFLAFTRLAKGNTALGTAILPINMLIQLALYPFYVNIFGGTIIGSSYSYILDTLVQWFLIPCISAFMLRFVMNKYVNKKLLEHSEKFVSICITILLALLLLQISADNIATFIANINIVPLIFGAVLLFFIIIFIIGEVIAKVMQLPYEDHALLTMTTTARNAPLMLAVTMAVIPQQPIIYAAIVIGMLIELPHLTLLKVVLLKRKNRLQFR